MSSKLLSVEIWKIICSGLRPVDIKQASMVCKQWNSILQYFLKYDIIVTLSEHNVHELANDLADCTSLRPRIKSLLIFTPLGGSEKRESFKMILGFCSEITLLHFYTNPHPELLKMLYHASTKLLPSIQSIFAYNFTKDLFLVLYKFRKTITTLQVNEIQDLPDQFEDLPAFSSQFPNLTVLTAMWGSKVARIVPINLNRLIIANRKLKELTLAGVPIVNRYTLNDTRRKVYPPIEKLVISFTDVNTSLLQFVIPQLTHLKRLYVNVDRVTSYKPEVVDNYEGFLKAKNADLEDVVFFWRYKHY